MAEPQSEPRQTAGQRVDAHSFLLAGNSATALWEIRLSGRDGIARALYVVAKDRRVVVVRAFVKKTRRTPRREIELALRRAGEVSK